MRKEKRLLTKEEVLQIPELLEKRLTYKDIGEHFGVHENTIKGWVLKLRKSGYKVITYKGKKALLDE